MTSQRDDRKRLAQRHHDGDDHCRQSLTCRAEQCRGSRNADVSIEPKGPLEYRSKRRSVGDQFPADHHDGQGHHHHAGGHRRNQWCDLETRQIGGGETTDKESREQQEVHKPFGGGPKIRFWKAAALEGPAQCYQQEDRREREADFDHEEARWEAACGKDVVIYRSAQLPLRRLGPFRRSIPLASH